MNNKDLFSENVYSLLYENYFFHDFYIEKITFSILDNKFRLILFDEERGSFSIIFKKIFSFTCNIDFLVEKKNYDVISWNRIFKTLQYRHLLTIDIEKSKYSNLSIKYLNKKALKIIINFDFGFNVKMDCIDIIIKKL